MSIRPWLRRLAGVAFFILLVLALLEGVLRFGPPVLGGRIANAVYGTYHGDRMYFRVREPRMKFMWTEQTARTYWNGYWWTHRTDRLGFRNPPDLTDRSLVLLGDSMIYGHGVEEEDTVAHFLREEHGRAAYNMARQGDCLFQQYILSRLFLPELRPETAVLFVSLNDFRDLEVYRDPEQITDPPELDRIDYEALAERVRHPTRRIRPRFLRVWQLTDAVFESVGSRPDPAAYHRELLAPILEAARFGPIARYYRLLLADLARRAAQQGTELVTVLIEVPDETLSNASAAQEKLLELLESIGRENGARALGTREIFHDCPHCFLANDGHFSHEGHRRLAALVAERIADR
jgi:hypothetical protein